MRTETREKQWCKKRKTVSFHVPSELLLTAGIPLDCDLMIETVPGVILIGIELGTDGLQTLSEGVR